MTQCLSNKCIEPQYNRIGLYFENKNKQKKTNKFIGNFFVDSLVNRQLFLKTFYVLPIWICLISFYELQKVNHIVKWVRVKKRTKNWANLSFFFSNDSNHFHLSFLLQLFHSKFKQFFKNVFMRKYYVIETHQTIQLDDRNFEQRLISCTLADYLLWF